MSKIHTATLLKLNFTCVLISSPEETKLVQLLLVVSNNFCICWATSIKFETTHLSFILASFENKNYQEGETSYTCPYGKGDGGCP